MKETPRDLENVQEKVTISPRNVTEAQGKLDKNSRNPKNTYGKVSESSKNSLNVPLPTSDPYMNFIQDFRAKYKGEEVTNTVMAALAAAKWRTMSEQERQPYVDITNKGREKKHKGIESLRKYITSLAV
uniref:HMG box domain-containing protein n=1 Tax=Homalodisca liturata TaxID=320908 RepID=A0A1B6H940_9HEMI